MAQPLARGRENVWLEIIQAMTDIWQSI